MEGERLGIAAARQAEGEGEQDQQAGRRQLAAPRRPHTLRRRSRRGRRRGPDRQAHAVAGGERIDGAVDEGAREALRRERGLDFGVSAVEGRRAHQRLAAGILAYEQAFRTDAAEDLGRGEPGPVLGGEPVRLAQAPRQLPGRRPVVEVVHRAMLEQPAFMQADHAPGQADDAVGAVRAVDQRSALRTHVLHQGRPAARGGAGVHVRERLIEHQHQGLAGDGAGHAQAFALAGGELGRPRLRAMVEGEACEHIRQRPARRRRRHCGEMAEGIQVRGHRPSADDQ